MIVKVSDRSRLARWNVFMEADKSIWQAKIETKKRVSRLIKKRNSSRYRLMRIFKKQGARMKTTKIPVIDGNRKEYLEDDARIRSERFMKELEKIDRPKIRHRIVEGIAIVAVAGIPILGCAALAKYLVS